MAQFTSLTTRLMPLPVNDIDTDQIIPARFLKATDKVGMGDNLFADWRYNSDGSPKPEFVLNKPTYKGAQILLAGDNFGCGSSREHAPWAIADYGFNTIISTSYADIFYNNCFKNGILAIRVNKDQLDKLMAEISANEGVRFVVDLENQQVITPAGNGFTFDIDPFRKGNLLSGLDDIGLTLKHVDKITQYEQQHKLAYPWLWA